MQRRIRTSFEILVEKKTKLIPTTSLLRRTTSSA
jgi:hypothetical protein